MDTDLDDLLAALDDLCRPSGAEWALRLEVAHDCCWSAEARITPRPHAQGPDRSVVSYIGAGARAIDVARTAVADVMQQFRPAKRTRRTLED